MRVTLVVAISMRERVRERRDGSVGESVEDGRVAM